MHRVYNKYNNNYKRNNFQNNNYSNSNYQTNQQQKSTFKKSGYQTKMTEEGPVCWGWKKSKAGLIKMYARPYKGTIEKVGEKNGNTWFNLFVTITNQNSGQIQKTSGVYCKETKKLYITELGWVGSPNGGGQTRSGKFSKGTLTKMI